MGNNDEIDPAHPSPSHKIEYGQTHTHTHTHKHTHTYTDTNRHRQTHRDKTSHEKTLKLIKKQTNKNIHMYIETLAPTLTHILYRYRIHTHGFSH